MEGISQVQVAAPQKNNNTKRNLIYAGISSGAGLGTWAYSNHLTNKELSRQDAFVKEAAGELEKAKQQIIDENKIRQEVAKNYGKGKPIPEYLKENFEEYVKDEINIERDKIKRKIAVEEQCYDELKKTRQYSEKVLRRDGLKNGVLAAVIVGSALAIFTVVKNMITSHSHKKEA
jgi:hypothetical protein